MAGPGPAEDVGLVIAELAGSRRDANDDLLGLLARRGGAVPRDRPGAPDGFIVRTRGPVLAGPPGRGRIRLGSGAGVRGRDIGRDIPTCLRRYVDVLSGRDTDRRDIDQGHPGQLGALADHMSVDPRGRLHLGEPAGRGKALLGLK
jgi:hypothetical protein